MSLSPSPQLLVDLGAKITVPTMAIGVDVTLTQAVSTLHIYRALSQPAYIMGTQFDIFGYAFKVTISLRVRDAIALERSSP